ncbi:hypothetical protein AsAng_0048970 [Aureispira anguillae]|uniref:Uncharacterized protein n=1 Tax=Aureispira anguillae TaxID=2864201 RepID=A0A916DVZ7_9BACT|nr:hypothetical protein AsAng_0048970 [Aureispira anguillae]
MKKIELRQEQCFDKRGICSSISNSITFYSLKQKYDYFSCNTI